MLTKLTVKNYALIEDLEVDFKNGFNVITGETGSGKSLLLGALGLILGQQADYSMLRDGDKKCISEASFQIKGIKLDKFFLQNDIDFDEETIVRRELSPSGKSRAFINDTPVTLKVLKEFSSSLIDIHSQNDQSKLSGKPFLYQVLDSFSSLEEDVIKFQYELKLYKTLKKELADLKAQEEQLKADRDYYEFQLGELKEINFSEIDMEKVETELHQLSNAESIQKSIYESSELLASEYDGALTKIKYSLDKLNSMDLEESAFLDIRKRLQEAYSDLDDAAFELTKFGEKVTPDEARLNELAEIQNSINTLLIKHRSKSVEDLEEKKTKFETLLNQADNFDGEISALQRRIEEKETDLLAKSSDLNKKRTAKAIKLSAFMNSGLADLGMPNAELKVLVSESEAFNEYGKNELSFSIQTNKGSGFSDLSKVASGGELSRIMFLIKAAVASKKQIATLVLDEIDTGISGEVASKLATQIREMGNNAQLIVVTHLAQMASKAHSHFKISKHDDEERTYTQLLPLSSEDGRIEELASLLSGDEITPAALENAKSLLEY